MRKAMQRANILIETEKKHWHTHFTEAVEVTRSNDETMVQIDKLNDAENKFKKFVDYTNSKLRNKYIFLTVLVFITAGAAYGSVGIIIFFFESSRAAHILEHALKDFLPYDSSIDQIFAGKPEKSDFLMTSWDVNNRSAKLYSKWTVKTYGNSNLSSTHNLTFGEMTAASAASTKFFFPYEKQYTF
jgi:hypothetical protein